MIIRTFLLNSIQIVSLFFIIIIQRSSKQLVFQIFKFDIAFKNSDFERVGVIFSKFKKEFPPGINFIDHMMSPLVLKLCYLCQ